ncbi:MAG: redox-regulated ATPase YchF [Deltaproteobacteria bacterium]|nr:redox-regulated ATPase YchF [Deltaproteobacteria bacterium]
MKLGIIGFPDAGKATIFEALTRSIPVSHHKEEDRVGTIRVPDPRIDYLSEIYRPRKTTYAQVEYFLPGGASQKKERNRGQGLSSHVKECDALIHVVRNFAGSEIETPSPVKDFFSLDQELMFSDLVVVEKRLERFRAEKQRGSVNADELSLLETGHELLENEIPLRRKREVAEAPLLKGYAFISAKPVLVLFNNNDDDDTLPDADNPNFAEECIVVRGRLEHEIAQMTDEEAAEFLAEYNIAASAMDRVIEKSYRLLGLISFFTVGDDEVRAWTIKRGTRAVDAAGAIHSDIRKGFIRAEVLAYNDFIAAGTYGEARKRGTVRLEGKEYEVMDGDIINFRFNV